MSNSELESIKVEVYATGLCGYCMRAKQLLEKKGIEYIEYRVDKERGLREEMEARSRRTSVPQIFIGDAHIGGFDELSELDIDEDLDPMLGLSQVT